MTDARYVLDDDPRLETHYLRSARIRVIGYHKQQTQKYHGRVLSGYLILLP
jgi:hypothetical protein